MKNRISSIIAMFIAIVMSLSMSGCGAGYHTLTAEQKSMIAFNTLNLALDTAEATFVLLETDGAEHLPTARAAFAILQSAIENYFAKLEIYGMTETPAYATEAIDAMNERARSLGVIES